VIVFAYLVSSHRITKVAPYQFMRNRFLFLLLIAATPGLVVLRFFFPLKKKVEIFFSIDGDVVKDKKSSSEAIKATMHILEARKVQRATWFINEGEFYWTKNYQQQLKAILEHGWKIQLHSHTIEQQWNQQGIPPSETTVRKALKKEKDRLDAFLKRNHTPKTYAFRAGKHMLGSHLKTLMSLQFSQDYSQYPGLKMKDAGGAYYDDTALSPAATLQHEKGVLRIPNQLFFAPLTYFQYARKTRGRIVLSHFFHPYELLDSKGNINKKRMLMLHLQFFLLHIVYPKKRYIDTEDLKKSG